MGRGEREREGEGEREEGREGGREREKERERDASLSNDREIHGKISNNLNKTWRQLISIRVNVAVDLVKAKNQASKANDVHKMNFEPKLA